MTPTEALEFLDAGCANSAMGRAAHVKGLQAVQVLNQLIIEGNGNGSGPEVHSKGDKEAGGSKKKSGD